MFEINDIGPYYELINGISIFGSTLKLIFLLWIVSSLMTNVQNVFSNLCPHLLILTPEMKNNNLTFLDSQTNRTKVVRNYLTLKTYNTLTMIQFLIGIH